MRIPWIKVGLFLCIWYELAVEFRIDANVALVLATAAIVGWFYLPRLLGSFVQYLGPLTTALAWRAVLWLALFWWVAPALLKSQPKLLIAVVAVLLALAGMRARQYFDWQGLEGTKALLRRHSAFVLIGAFAVVGGTFAAVRVVDPPWLLIGYAMLPGLPLLTGWQLAEAAAPKRADARFGDDATFREAGMSEER